MYKVRYLIEDLFAKQQDRAAATRYAKGRIYPATSTVWLNRWHALEGKLISLLNLPVQSL